MKLLITGVLPWSIWTIAKRLAQGEHDVTLIGQTSEAHVRDSRIHHVKMNLTEKETLRYISAGGFDAIIFFFACQCEDRREYSAVQGGQLDVLFDILHGAEQTSVNQFILVTDQRVFGENQEAREDEQPIPDTPTGIMIRAAESCVSCGAPAKLKNLIIRTTSLYAEDDPESFFSDAVRAAERQEPLLLNGSADFPCDFLHAEDLGVFLDYAVGMELEGVVHAVQGIPVTYADMIEDLQCKLPALSVTYLPGGRCRNSLQGTVASSMGWVPRHDFRRELDALCGVKSDEHASRRRFRLRSVNSAWSILKWVEVVLLAALAIWLTVKGESNALLATVDYMLLYVITIGFIHGRGAGIIAAVLTCVWYCWSFVSKGGAPSDLLFNTDHWLPMSVYILCGALFGYGRDRQRTRAELLQREQEEVSRERDFIENIYERTYQDRNQLKEQIYHYRDSYGRIYQNTKELDTLQPVQVFLSTLQVLESTLQNESVSIYECKPNTTYIRLVVRSREMKQLPKSLNLKDYEPMYEQLQNGKLYANHTLMSGYPVFALPIISEGEMLAVLMLWNVPFDQQSMYTENLLSVVAGLVQSALIRAIQYHQQMADLYFEDTHILTPEAFRSALGIYQSIRQRRTGDYVLVQVNSSQELSMEMIDKCLSKLIRSTDIAGRLDNGEYYVLFPQATTDRIPIIDARFSSYGLKCEVVSENLEVE